MSDTTTTPEEMQAHQVRQQEAAMKAAGEATETRVQQDYFGFEKVERVLFPDGISYIEHKVFTEGQRRKFLNESARDVRVQKVTGDALMKMKPGDERHSLLTTAIVGWNLTRGGEPITFSPRNLEMFLENADPRLLDTVEKEIRKSNPWLMANLTSEDIKQQIKELEEMLDTKLAEEEKEQNFR